MNKHSTINTNSTYNISNNNSLYNVTDNNYYTKRNLTQVISPTGLQDTTITIMNTMQLKKYINI